MSYLIATYLVHGTYQNLEKKAESIALGLTVGSWTDLPHLDKKLLSKHRGEVISIERFDKEAENKGIIKIAYPLLNFSPDIPAILTTVFGKLSLDGKIRLLDLEFPNDLKKHFSGPQFGLENIRQKLNVHDRPLLMAIFKGVIGRDLTFLSNQLRNLALGGVDIVKDDEILFENSFTPFEQRITVMKRTLQEAYEQTGHRTLYSVNISGKTKEVIERARLASDLGADIILLNAFSYGMDLVQTLREDPFVRVPIMVHPAVSGAMTSSKVYGISPSLLLGKLLRIAGADFVLFASPYGSVAMDRSDAFKLHQELIGEDPYFKKCFSVPSAGIHPGLTEKIMNDFGKDTIINAGGGVFGHPEGPTKGVIAFRQAIDNVSSGRSLFHPSKDQNELKVALQTWQ